MGRPKKSTENAKKRNWNIIVYPESAPVDWIDILTKKGLKGVISPLHDRDVVDKCDSDGDVKTKKPHYHVILCFDGPTTYAVVKRITDELHTVIPQPCESVRGSYRYLTHRDDPNKAQYDEDGIVSFGGFDAMDYIEPSRSELVRLRASVMDFIRKFDIGEYADLLEILRDSEMWDEFDTATSNTILFRGYIQSRRHQVRDKAWHERMERLLDGGQNVEDEALELNDEEGGDGGG